MKFELILLSSILFYLYICPYTKVEESFNMQALHDILFYGLNLSSYDHFEFPGVVPRTFLGPLVISSIAYPVKFLLSLSKINCLYLCRGILGLIVFYSYHLFKKSIDYKFGNRIGNIWCILLAFQFHICFYSSRSLPNIFSLCLVMISYSKWLQVS